MANQENIKKAIALADLLMQAVKLEIPEVNKTAIKAVEPVLDLGGAVAFPLCIKKNCGTIGYAIVSVADFHSKVQSAGVIVWVGDKTREQVEEEVESFGAVVPASDTRTAKQE
jgi:hypothetical protein